MTASAATQTQSRTSSKLRPRVAMMQIGARRHYAVPRILSNHGALERLYTDLWVPDGIPRSLVSVASTLRSLPINRAVGRQAHEIPSARVTPIYRFGISYYLRRKRSRTPEQRAAVYRWAVHSFGKAIVSRGFAEANSVYAYSMEAREVFRAAKDEGLFCILDQMNVPVITMSMLLKEEVKLWPAWEDASSQAQLPIDFEREQDEWELSDLVIAPSQFILEELQKRHVRGSKCVLAPYGLGLSNPIYTPHEPLQFRPLRVLFLGAVCLRKGVPYFLNALKKLSSSNIEARAVGEIVINRKALRGYEHFCSFLGPVPRPAVRAHLAWADVLVLPSLFEGSAQAGFEALAYGIVAIATPNAGTVVRDGIEGFIVPARSSEAIAEKLNFLAEHPTLLTEMARRAFETSKDYTLDRYGTRLMTIVADRFLKHAGQPSESS